MPVCAILQPAELGRAGMMNSRIPNRTASIPIVCQATQHSRRKNHARRTRIDCMHASASLCRSSELEVAQRPMAEDVGHAPYEKSKALVLGGGIAGLAAAAAISQHFDEVFILERENVADLEAQGERRGVPQHRQPHLLLMGGAKLLEKYLPGFEQDCVAEGALIWDILENNLHYTFGTYAVQAPAGEGRCRLIGASRNLLEGVLRRRVLEKPKVFFRSSSAVTGLTFSGDGSRVTGVRLKDGSEVMGDLVVDALGGGSRLLEWLEAADVKGLLPPETVQLWLALCLPPLPPACRLA
eukprot:jgi/Botrbrau1/5518/Bobra.0023s0006.1